MSYKVLLFDLDDTLIHFEDYWRVSLLEAFRRHHSTRGMNPPLFFDVFWRHNSVYEAKYHAQEISLQQFRNYRLIDALAECNRHIDEMTASDFNDLHREISKRFMKVNSSLLDLLHHLKQNYLLGIVTNGTAQWQNDKLDAMGIRNLFPDGSIFISDEVGFEKPNPEIYLQALNYFQASPGDTVFIGDSWKNDVAGPGQLGIQSIWLNKRSEEIPENSNLIAVINNIYEIKNYV